MFKCEFVRADVLVPSELKICYALFDVYWVKVFVMRYPCLSVDVVYMLVCISVPSCDTETSR